MPELSIFYGIRITMNWSEHNPPHIHIEYGEFNATVLINDGVIDRGFLPKRQLKYVLAWCDLHQNELMQNWELARSGKKLIPIAPLI